MPDFLSTTQIVTYVRKRLTPTVAWSAIGALVTGLMVTITWIVTMQSDMHQFKEGRAEDKKAVADLQAKFDMLQDIKTSLAVVNSKLDALTDEVDRQREWREHVQGIAESPPHARKRH